MTRSVEPSGLGKIQDSSEARKFNTQVNGLQAAAGASTSPSKHRAYFVKNTDGFRSNGQLEDRHDEDTEIAAAAKGVLSYAASTLEVAEALIDAGVLERLAGILGSHDREGRERPRRLMMNLAFASHNLGRTYGPRVLYQFLSAAEHDVVEDATYALSFIARSLEGAKMVIDAKALDYGAEILGPPDRKGAARELMTNLASHNLRRTYGPRLMSFLSATHHVVVEAATYALSLVAKSPEGAKTVINAKALDYVAEILGSPDRDGARELMTNLASHNLGRTYVAKGPFSL
ncbi:hypothetical protein DFH06DRAFT_1317538 [Mycena polygramma]|nr:hypothetical protein DFH06DRAFT_1317538 [Mycena polygramma]